MTPYLLFTALMFVLAVNVATARGANGPNIKVRTSEAIVATWQCEDKIPRPRTKARSPWKHHSRAYRAAELNRWTNRLAACRAFLKERARQYHWEEWLPPHGRRLAICETSMRWDFVGSSSDGHFVSAFAISVQVYNRDAARMGVRGWWDKPFPPSPWEQWQAAIGHYKMFGDGWTGHCHGIMKGTNA